MAAPSAGRPQDAEIHQKILAATLDIMGEQGVAAVTFDAVAQRAHTSRPAIYRRWKNKQDLLADAVETQRPVLTIPDTGNLRGDLYSLADQFIQQYSTQVARQATLTILTATVLHSETMATWAKQYASPRINETRIIFDRAITRQELDAEADISTMMLILSSTLLLTCLQPGLYAHEAGRQKRIHTVIDLILDRTTTK